MRTLRLFVVLLGWDLRREMRRRETLPNMLLFSVLVLFLARLGVDSEPRTSSTIGPVFFWVTILFAGTIGLSQSFAAEREGGALTGVMISPADLGVFYLAKVLATTIQVFVLEVLLLGIYAIFFGYPAAASLSQLFLALALFTLGYMGAGVVLAAMTTTLRGGGEVVLRIVLVPLMVPFLWVLLRHSKVLFDAEVAGGVLGGHYATAHFFTFCAALDAMYLASGFVLFPKVLED